MGKVYVGDIGTIVKLDSGVALGTPTVLKIKYKKPSGELGSWPSVGNATVVESTKAQYTITANDLDEEGMWTFQIYAELAGGWKGHGEPYMETIYPLEVD